MDIFLGSSQNWTIFRGHFYAFYGLFLRSRYKMGVFFGSLKLQFFGGVFEIPDIFLVNGRCDQPRFLSHYDTTVLSCQPRVTVTSCSVYKVIGDLLSINR